MYSAVEIVVPVSTKASVNAMRSLEGRDDRARRCFCASVAAKPVIEQTPPNAAVRLRAV